MFTSESLWQDVINARWEDLKEKLSQSDPECPNHQYSISNGHLTISQALDVFKGTDAGHQLMRILVLFIFPDMSRDIRLQTIRNLCEVDPPSAASMYVFVPHLTDEEDAIILSAIGECLPVTHEKIALGKVRRAKDG